MKKVLSVLLILCIIFSVCSCARKNDEPTAKVDDLAVNDGSSEKPKEEQQKPEDNKEQNPSNNKVENKAEEDDTHSTEDNTPSDDKEEQQKPEDSQDKGDNTMQEDITTIPNDDKSYTSKSEIILGDQASMFFFSGENSHTAIFEQVDTNFAKKYITELKKQGFKKYTETSFNSPTGSKVNTFATYQTENWVVDLDHHSAVNRLYVTYTHKDDRWVLPPLTKPTYTDCGMPTIITQVGAERFHKEAVSMCYIIRGADGSFIVYDSDYGDGMAELIYDILKKQAPDPNNIVISAWVVTHPHTDHVGAFLDFADKYAGDKTITLQQMVYNYPDDTYVSSNGKNLIARTPEAAKKLNENVTFVRPHAGNVLYYANLTFRVLYTQEQYLAPTEGKIVDLNGASLVMQMETDRGVKVFFGADHPVDGSSGNIPFCEGALHKWYGNYIKSDIVTLFHHGFGGGADLEIYNYIKPSVVLWPASFYRLTHDSDGTPYSDIKLNSRNLYFTDPEKAKQNGVKGYYISGDRIHIVDLSNKKLEVTEYETCDKYLGK